jgi:DNA-binding response OmpR family regulator
LEGYRVLEAENGRDALDKLRETHPDLLTLDIIMPKLSGLDLIPVIRSSPEIMGIPIIVISVLEEMHPGRRLGIDRYFSKPLDVSALLREVGQLLEEGMSRRRVMVVDDDPRTVDSLAEALKAHGYHVTSAYGYEESLEKARTDRPDIVIASSRLSRETNLAQTLHAQNGLEDAFFLLYE